MTSSSPSSSHDHSGSSSYQAHHDAYDSEDDDEEICVDDEDRGVYGVPLGNTVHTDDVTVQDPPTLNNDPLEPLHHSTPAKIQG